MVKVQGSKDVSFTAQPARQNLQNFFEVGQKVLGNIEGHHNNGPLKLHIQSSIMPSSLAKSDDGPIAKRQKLSTTEAPRRQQESRIFTPFRVRPASTLQTPC